MNPKALNYVLDNSKLNHFHKVLLAICFFVITFSGYELSVFGAIVPVVMMPAIYTIGAFSLFGMGIKANLLVLYLFVALIGAFAFAAHSLMNTFASQYYPSEIRTTGVGFANSTGRIGGMLGPIVGGMLLTAHVPINVWFLTFAIPGIVAALAITIINLQTKYFENSEKLVNLTEREVLADE